MKIKAVLHFFAQAKPAMNHLVTHLKYTFFMAVWMLMAACNQANETPKNVDSKTLTSKKVTPEERIKELTDQINGSQPYAELYEERCHLLTAMRRYKEAKFDAKNALGLKPNKPYYYFLVAKAHKNLGEADSALIAAHTAETQGFAHDSVYTLIGQCYLIFRKYNKAIEYFDKALKLSPYYAPAYHYKGLAFAEMRDTAKAISTLQTAVEQQPEYSDAYNSLVALFIHRKQYDLAEQATLSALRFAPDDPFALFNLGLLLERKNMPDSAAFFYRKAIYHKPDFYQAYFNLGLHAFNSGNYHEAAEYFEKAQNPDALDETTLYNYGLTLEKLNRCDEAIRYFKKVVLIKGDHYRKAEAAIKRCETNNKSVSKVTP